MNRIDSIKISVSGDYGNAVEIYKWDSDEDTLHLAVPKGSKVHLDINGLPIFIELPDQSRLYFHLDDFEKVKLV